jgi:KDO2-lipid IV(A) lauroyltransferase
MSRPLISRVGPLGRAFSAVLIGIIGRLSPVRLEKLASFLARLAWTLGIRKQIALDNLRQAFPEKTAIQRAEIARHAYRNMALTALEGMSAASLSDEDVERRVVIENWEPLEAAIQAGNGVLVATAHFGSWELLGSVMARRTIPMHAVVRPLAGALNARIIESRLKNGLSLIPPRGAVMGAVKAVRKGGVVVMLMDQVLAAKHGVFVPFFGRMACTNPSLSAAAFRTGAPVFVVMGAREKDRLRLYCEGPFPLPPERSSEGITEHTATLTAVLERYIRQYPEQWLWMHRRWKVQPPKR